jgi:hypothetical protein
MAPKESKICKQAAAGTTRHITLTIPETIEIIRKPGSATSQNSIMAAYNTGCLTNYDIRKHNKKNCL